MLTETTADLAFTLLMSAARQVPYLDQWTKTGQWSRTVGQAQFGQEIFGQTLGIIGLGNIGAAIARRGFHGFNMNILRSSSHMHKNARKIRIGTTLKCTFLRIR